MKLYSLIVLAALIVPRVVAQGNFPALLAAGPNPQYKEKLQLFGQFVGSWVFEGTEYR